MFKFLQNLLVCLFVPLALNAYIPDDPDFMCAEKDSPQYREGAWIYDEAMAFFSFAPQQSAVSALYWDTLRFGQPQVSGSSIELAWDIFPGAEYKDEPVIDYRPAVIAIIDTGVVWDDDEIIERLFLNREELPLPEGSAVYDLNGDGIFNVVDYLNDSRLAGDPNGNGLLDPQDLIQIFSDGIDDDGNGFIDDICGWDFFEDDNDPEDSSSYSAGHYHGKGQMRKAAAQQGRGVQQSAPTGSSGVCPNCLILPVKDWDSFAVDTCYYGLAVLYAARMQASVIEGAVGGFNNSGICRDAFKQADEAGLPIFIVSSDINSANHNYPTYLNEAVYVSGIVPDTFGVPGIPPTTYFRDSNLTQFGGKNQISFECMSGSEATAMASGAAGLLMGYARLLDVELHPDQVRQLLQMTAEDVLPENTGFIGRPDPAQVGWDQHFGYGRVDLYEAMLALEAGALPPVARITSPGWNSYVAADSQTLPVGLQMAGRRISWVLEAGYGIEPLDFRKLASGSGVSGGVELKVAEIAKIFPVELSGCPAEPDPLDPGAAGIQPNRHIFTLRLRVHDTLLDTHGEDRRTLFLHRDETLHAGWPRVIPAGGEGSPLLEDLDGDKLLEVIVPSSDGQIYIYTHDGRPFSFGGQTVELRADTFLLAGKHGLASADYPLRPGFYSIAVADLDGDGIKEVVGSAGYKLYCFEVSGKHKFEPINYSTAFFDELDQVDFDNHIGPGAIAAPVLFDLDGDGDLEIIQGGCDQRIHVWHHDGRVMSGFPVKVRAQASGARILHSPAMADLDGDGTYEIVVATNEVTPAPGSPVDGMVAALMDGPQGVPAEFLPFVADFASSLMNKNCVVHALQADGTPVKGWPVLIPSLLPDLLPLLGPSLKPAACDFDADGDDEVVVSFTSSRTAILDGDGRVLREMDQGPVGAKAVGMRDTTLMVNMFDSPALGDIDADGVPEIAQGGITLLGALNLILAGQNLPYNHIMQVWDSATGKFEQSYPRTMDDHMLYAEPAMADVSGDGIPEIVCGSGLYLLHALGADGLDQPGFPKLNGGWVMTTPAVADIDGDGLNEVVVVNREGGIFVWDTPGLALQGSDWPTYAHDNANTSNFGLNPVAPSGLVGPETAETAETAEAAGPAFVSDDESACFMGVVR